MKYQGDISNWAELDAHLDDPMLPTDDEIIVAKLDSYDYEESLLIVFEQDGQLYEWEDAHCSCNGFSTIRIAESNKVTTEYLNKRYSKRGPDSDIWEEIASYLLKNGITP